MNKLDVNIVVNGTTENLSPCIIIIVDFLFILPRYSVIPVNSKFLLNKALFIGKVINYVVKLVKLLAILI